MSKRYVAETPYGNLELPRELLRTLRGGHFEGRFANQHLGLMTKLSSMGEGLPIRIYNDENLIDGGVYLVTTKTVGKDETLVHFHRKSSLPDD